MGSRNLRHTRMLNPIMMHRVVGILWFLMAHTALAQNSVLSEGEWYKIGVTQQGIHKIDYNFLQEAGIAVNNIDPRHISIYGNGGGMLPQPNEAPRPTDLQENAIFVQGEADGSFDSQDFILFYGQSPDQ